MCVVDGVFVLIYVVDSVIGGVLVFVFVRLGLRYMLRRDSGWLATEDDDEAEVDDAGI